MREEERQEGKDKCAGVKEWKGKIVRRRNIVRMKEEKEYGRKEGRKEMWGRVGRIWRRTVRRSEGVKRKGSEEKERGRKEGKQSKIVCRSNRKEGKEGRRQRSRRDA